MLQHNWSLLCCLSPALVLLSSCWPGLDENRFRVCRCLYAVSLAFSFLVSMIYGAYTTARHRSARDDSLVVSVDMGTNMHATRSASTMCRGRSWQHLHQPCVAGLVSYPLSLPLSLSLSLSLLSFGARRGAPPLRSRSRPRRCCAPLATHHPASSPSHRPATPSLPPLRLPPLRHPPHSSPAPPAARPPGPAQPAPAQPRRLGFPPPLVSEPGPGDGGPGLTAGGAGGAGPGGMHRDLRRFLAAVTALHRPGAGRGAAAAALTNDVLVAAATAAHCLGVDAAFARSPFGQARAAPVLRILRDGGGRKPAWRGHQARCLSKSAMLGSQGRRAMGLWHPRAFHSTHHDQKAAADPKNRPLGVVQDDKVSATAQVASAPHDLQAHLDRLKSIDVILRHASVCEYEYNLPHLCRFSM